MRRFSLLLAAFLASAGAALAQTPPPAAAPAPPAGVEWRRYPSAREVQIRDAAAIVYVMPESRPDVAVAVVPRGAGQGIALSAHGRRLRIDGRASDAGACRVEEGGAFAVQIGGAWVGAACR